MATPLLRVTNDGLAAATLATPTGPFINIKRWRLADGYGYEPQPGDDSLNGTILYTDVPRSYQNVGDNTMDIICQLPPAAGPFEYGEIGLYIDDANGNEVLFAKGVWDYPQSKASSLGTNVNSQVTFHCLLKLQQSIAILKIDTLVAVAVWEVDRWSDVIIPTLSAHSEVPLVLVRELDGNSDSTLLTTGLPESDSWTVGTNYDFLARTEVVNATTNSVTVPLSSLPHSILTDFSNRRVVLELEGFSAPYRSVSSLLVSGNNAVLSLNPSPLSSLPTVDAPVVLYEQRMHKKIPIATRTEPGLVKPGDGLTLDTEGLITTSGILHGVPGSGRNLTNSDNLNATNWNSGEYWVASSSSRPSNGPPGVTVGGRVRMSNPGGSGILQQYFPYQNTNDYNHAHSRVWHRMYQNSAWSAWQSTPITGTGISSSPSGVFSTQGLLHGVPGSGQPLNSSHNVNSTSWGSGEYAVGTDASRPAGLPPTTTRGGRLRISNYAGHILQEYYPMWQGTSQINPNNKAWWRIWNSSQGWSGWRTMSSSGDSGTWQSLPPGAAAPSRGFVVIAMRGGEHTFANYYVSGRYVTRTGDSYHDSSHFGWNSVTLPLNQGQVWTYSPQNTRGSTSPTLYQFYGLG